MELRQLKYVVSVAKYLNFSKAATACFISQPTISQQIINLEKELGVKLFERNNPSLILTPTGKDFVTHAKRILNELNLLHQSMQDHEALKKGYIRIGTLPSAGKLNLISHICSFYTLYPGIQTQIIEAGGNDLMKFLAAGTLDIAFLIPSQHDMENQSVEFHSIEQGYIVAILAKNHPLANKNRLYIKDIATERLIVPPVTHSLHKLIWDAWVSCGFEPQIVSECSQLDALLEFAAHGFGIGFASSQVIANIPHSDTIAIELAPPITRTSCLALPKTSSPSPATIAFRNFILRSLDLNSPCRLIGT